MKKYLPLFLLLLVSVRTERTLAWGFFAHKQINRMAVFCLPPEMFGFFKQHIDYISEHAVDPDKRRYLVEGEGVKHFIDMDRYEKVLPFDTLPKTYKEAMEKYSKDTLHTYGVGPWNIQWMLRKLTDAFSVHDSIRILKYAAELGHYVADCHVPLHSTSNYNGQQTGQQGIHAFFESRLPELFFENYSIWPGQAQYLDDPLQRAWQAVEGSYAGLPQVLLMEKKVQQEFKGTEKYTYETKGNQLVRVYSPAFSAAYHTSLRGMVENRLSESVLGVASFWYTAWVNAGQPDLMKLQQVLPDTSLVTDRPLVLPEQMLGRQEE